MDKQSLAKTRFGKKLVIIDGNAIMHRAFHAIPRLTTPRGKPINAVYGLVSMLLNIVQNLNPSHLVVCFDEKKPTFRHIEFKKYQSHRPPTHNDLISQFSLARDFLKAAGVLVYSKRGYEADDLIGTIATQVTSHQSQVTSVIIVTGDKDILQLVNDKIKLFMPIRGLSTGKIFGKDETKEKLGVGPDKIVDYKGLVGDPSDNYKGVAGIGPKTAISLLSEFGSFKSIYKNLSKIPESSREKLIKSRKDADMSYKLAKIVTNVPMKFNFSKMDDWDLGSPKVIKLFEEFGFKTLTKRVSDYSKQLEKERQMTLL